MPVFKDEKRGTWYVMAWYRDWTGERKQKCKRGFPTKREAQDWERSFQMQTAADMIKPQLQKEEAESGKSASGTVIIGTVKGDRHDIGKNLCRLMLEGRGLNVIDLGVDVPAEKFVAEAQKHNAKVIGCSALLTTTMPEMGRVVEKVKEAGLDAQVLVGGAPVSDEFAKTIGATYTPDAATCADQAIKILSA